MISTSKTIIAIQSSKEEFRRPLVLGVLEFSGGRMLGLYKSIVVPFPEICHSGSSIR